MFGEPRLRFTRCLVGGSRLGGTRGRDVPLFRVVHGRSMKNIWLDELPKHYLVPEIENKACIGMNHKVDKLEWFLLELSSCIGQIFIRIVSKGIFVQSREVKPVITC